MGVGGPGDWDALGNRFPAQRMLFPLVRLLEYDRDSVRNHPLGHLPQSNSKAVGLANPQQLLTKIMFWSSKKKIPAPQHERYTLAKRLYLMRLNADPMLRDVARSMGVDPTAYTGEQVFTCGFPESMILTITEYYLSLEEKGASEITIVQLISGHFGKIALNDGTYPPTPPVGTDFFTYLRQFVDALTRGHAQVSDDMIMSQTREVIKFYKR